MKPKSKNWTLRKIIGQRIKYELIRHCVDKDEHLGTIVRLKSGLWQARHEEHSRLGEVHLVQGLTLTGARLRPLAAHLYRAAMCMPMQGVIEE